MATRPRRCDSTLAGVVPMVPRPAAWWTGVGLQSRRRQDSRGGSHVVSGGRRRMGGTFGVGLGGSGA